MAHKLAKKLVSVKPGTLFAGVDMALERNMAVLMTERAGVLTQFHFPNDRLGYDYLLGRLRAGQERCAAPAVLVGMEPTNYFWKLLAAELERQSVPYRLVNPYTVKKHREGDNLDRSKDDPRDAFTIADLLRTGKFTGTRLLHGPYADLRQYAQHYDRLQQELRRHKNLILALAGQLFPELGRAFKDRTGQTALALLRSPAAACVIREQSGPALLAQVAQHFSGKGLARAKLTYVHQLAATSVGLTEGLAALQWTLTSHIATWELLQQQCAQVQARLGDLFLTLPEAPYWLSVPRLGLVSAALIAAELGDPHAYHQVDQWIKLAGTQPVPNTTGKKAHSLTPMSHQGRPRLRTVVYFAVLRLVQNDEAFGRTYVHLQTRTPDPLTKMQALGVLMNKLLRILWALGKQRRFYDPTWGLPAA
jgi:transposase